MKVLAAACLILALITDAAGQAGRGSRRVAGTVVDENGNALAGAKVAMALIESEWVQSRVPLVPKAKVREAVVFGTKTDRKGRWAFNGLASARWEIRASFPGFADTVTICDLMRISRDPRVTVRLERIKDGFYAADPALLERANELFGRGEYGSARLLYESYLVKDPDAIGVLLVIGDCWRRAGDRARAILAYRTAADRASMDPRRADELGTALGKIGECYIEEGSLELALDCLRRAAASCPRNTTIQAELGDVLFSMARAAESVPHFLSAIEIAPGNALLHFKLGLAYLNLKDWRRARECLSKVLEIDPGSDLARQARDLLASFKDRKEPAIC